MITSTFQGHKPKNGQNCLQPVNSNKLFGKITPKLS